MSNNCHKRNKEENQEKVVNQTMLPTSFSTKRHDHHDHHHGDEASGNGDGGIGGGVGGGSTMLNQPQQPQPPPRHRYHHQRINVGNEMNDDDDDDNDDDNDDDREQLLVRQQQQPQQHRRRLRTNQQGDGGGDVQFDYHHNESMRHFRQQIDRQLLAIRPMAVPPAGQPQPQQQPQPLPPLHQQPIPLPPNINFNNQNNNANASVVVVIGAVLPSIRTMFSFAVALFTIGLAVYINFPEPPLSPMLYQWKQMGGGSGGEVSVSAANDNGDNDFKYQGYRIFYIDKHNNDTISESNLTLIYLHGFPTSSYDLHRMFYVLNRHFTRIIAPDFLGFGFSDKPFDYPYSIVDQADMIAHLIVHHLTLTNVHFLTHDYGDSIAQELLARQSAGELKFKIESIVMLNGGIFPMIHRPVLMQNLLRTPVLGSILSRLNNYYTFAVSISGVFGTHTAPSTAELYDMWKLIRINDGYKVWGSLLRYIAERAHYEQRWIGALAKCSAPLHFIYGPADPVNPSPLFVQTYNRLVVKPKITVLADGIGHYPQLEAPGEVLSVYLEWLHTIGVMKKINLSMWKSDVTDSTGTIAVGGGGGGGDDENENVID